MLLSAVDQPVSDAGLSQSGPTEQRAEAEVQKPSLVFTVIVSFNQSYIPPYKKYYYTRISES